MKLDPFIMNHVKTALQEDLLEKGDVTSRAIFNDTETSQVYLISKDAGVLAGTDVYQEVFRQIDPSVEIEFFKSDGDVLKEKDTIARLTGPTFALLEGERTALNYLGHLSGIATATAQYCAELEGKTRILDTRKTIPGLRFLEKYAVNCGGGTNHRMGLHDMVMIKDNHIDAAGSITEAVKRVRKKWDTQFKIEVETRNLNEIEEALACSVDRILLDNMTTEMLKQAVTIIGDKAETEASGNMTLERIKEVSLTGVDFISVGALTHSVKVFDFSMRKQTNIENI
ncbi:carboxylating nicotinate-nucleotide diphosphorylase [Spirochaeta cellobiosiphila]|uniref:carboxylating nicotinate-nucleotide diphosphorylase n=1 Tax=Spirochaeta cellobiosiphila TaxID=504483 RepID=UPI00042A6284|nr:carboxylating nicotinate-nucleotide diphosphorylase [Spirochaeta cellobiosiphila]